MLASALEQVRSGTDVHVHLDKLEYIDHACFDLLANWEKQHKTTNGSLTIEWDELSRKFHQRRSGSQKTALKIKSAALKTAMRSKS
jgi:hypothetical protein